MLRKNQKPAGPIKRFFMAINDALAKAGHWMGLVITPLVVTAVYLCVLGPVSLIARLSGKDPLGLAFDRQDRPASFFNPVDFHNNTIDACRRQF